MARARVWTTRAEQRRARVEQLCVGVEQRWQGLRSVTPSPHAAGAQRLTQLRVHQRLICRCDVNRSLEKCDGNYVVFEVSS